MYTNCYFRHLSMPTVQTRTCRLRESDHRQSKEMVTKPQSDPKKFSAGPISVILDETLLCSRNLYSFDCLWFTSYHWRIDSNVVNFFIDIMLL